jgi:uncharacterized repeat protein (TIGR01451 family)
VEFTMRKLSRAAFLGGATLLVVVGVATPAFAEQIDNPAGPITRVQITPDLNCDVGYLGDASPEFFGTTACGTFLFDGDLLYGPAFIPAGGALLQTPFVAVDQALTGTGTGADPYEIETDVGAGASFDINQVDSYIVGQNAYRSDITVTNNGGSAQEVVLSHGGDCFLQDSDQGFGRFDAATGTVTCLGMEPGSDPPVPGDRVEQFIPLSADSNYLHSFYSDVWAAIGSGLPLPDECRFCDEFQDNGMALSWTVTIPAGGSITRSLLTNFSPTGLEAIPTAITAEDLTPLAGQQDGLEVTITNPNDVAASVADLQMTLPAGATYVAGSTGGALTEDPSINGDVLVYAGPIDVPAGGDATLTLDITAPLVPGPATITVDGGDAGAAPVLDSAVTLDVQPVDADSDLSITLTADPTTLPAGDDVTWSASATNAGPDAAPNAQLSFELPAGFTVDDVTATPDWDCAATAPVICTTDSFAVDATVDVVVTTSTATDTAPGTYTGTATIASPAGNADPDNNSAEASVVIEAPTATPTVTPTLPPTGAGDTPTIGLLAMSALGLGALLVVVAGRRVRRAS